MFIEEREVYVTNYEEEGNVDFVVQYVDLILGKESFNDEADNGRFRISSYHRGN